MSVSTLFSESEIIDSGTFRLVPTSAEIPIVEVHMLQAIISHNPDIAKVFPNFTEVPNDFTEAELVIGGFALGN